MQDIFFDNWLWFLIGFLVLMLFSRKGTKKARKSGIRPLDYVPATVPDKKSAQNIINRFAADLGSGSRGAKHYMEVLDEIIDEELEVIKDERKNADVELADLEVYRKAQLKAIEVERKKYDLSAEEYNERVRELDSDIKEEMKPIKRIHAWCDKQEQKLNTDLSKPLKFILKEAKKCWNEGGWDTFFHFTAADYPGIQDKAPH